MLHLMWTKLRPAARWLRCRSVCAGEILLRAACRRRRRWLEQMTQPVERRACWCFGGYGRDRIGGARGPAAVGAGRGRGVGMPACATANEWGRLRGSGTGPAMGSDAGSASATGATGEADANGVAGGSGQTLLDARSATRGRRWARRLAAGGAEIRPECGRSAAGLDIAILLEVVGTGAGRWRRHGRSARRHGYGRSGAILAPRRDVRGRVHRGHWRQLCALRICWRRRRWVICWNCRCLFRRAGTGNTAMVWIVGGLTGPM